MNAIPPDFTPAPGTAGLSLAPGAGGATAMRWAALADAATLVATLAGLDPEADDPAMLSVPARIRDAEGWRRERAENGVADLAAIMEPGISALLAVNARGADPRPAAQALWHEFAAARSAILALLATSPDPASAA